MLGRKKNVMRAERSAMPDPIQKIPVCPRSSDFFENSSTIRGKMYVPMKAPTLPLAAAME
jgi:hypothetical protein